MQEPTGIPAGAHDDESQSIMEEVRRQMGYAPPSMHAVMNEPAALRVAWAAVRLGFIDNPLPQLFKQQLLMLVARESVAYQGVVVVGSALRRSGMASADILALLNEPIPSLSVICQRLRTASRQWAYPSTWAMMPAELEKCVLMASVRLAVRHDRGGRCAQLLRELLGDVQFNAMLLLTSFAGLQQASFAARSGSDEGLTAEYDAMLADAPDLAKSWEDAARKLTRHRVSKRERKLMAEIGRQDRIREALRQSERRFRRIVENAAFPLMIYAEDGEVVMLNRAWEQLSGWDRKAIPDVQTWMRKAQLDRADWSCEDLEALRGWESAIDEGEQRIRTCDGQVRRWNFTTAALGVLADGRQAIMRMAVDVTERRDLEDALWETNRRMVGILDSITDGFSAIDRNEQVLYINDKLAEMIPCSREEVLGRPFREIFPVPTAVARAIQRCLTERTTEHVEHYLPARQRFYEMRFYPTSEGLAALVRDISERKRFEHKLASSEQRFRSLFESNMLGIMFANRRTGEVLDCNDAMLQVVGYSREDLEQGKVNWIQMTAPEWRDVDRLAAQGVGEGPLVPYEKEYLHKDGRRIPALVGGAPFNGSDDIVFAFVLDRTEQKRLQRQVEHDRRTLQAIVSGAPIAIVLVTEEGSVHLWNPAAEKLFGWQAIEVLGKKIPVIVQERAAPFLEGIRRIMSGFEFPETPRPVTCKCGKVLTVLAKAMPARDEQGSIIGALLLMRPTDAA